MAKAVLVQEAHILDPTAIPKYAKEAAYIKRFQDLPDGMFFERTPEDISEPGTIVELSLIDDSILFDNDNLALQIKGPTETLYSLFEQIASFEIKT